MPSTDVLPPIVATDTAHLKECIHWAVTCHGPSVNLNHIDVSRITDMTELFSNSPFNGDISQWDVSNVTRANGMFFSSPFNGDISNWNTGKLGVAIGMFRLSQFNGDLSRWDTSSLYNARVMFAGCAFEGDISQWDVSNLENVERMFLGSKNKSDLSPWLLKKNCKLTWMTNENFQGILPRINGGAESLQYGRMFGQHTALRAYLKTRPFSHVHATLLMGLKSKPEWASTQTFKQVKSIQAMAKTLGVKGSGVHALVMNHFAGGAKAPESFFVDELTLD